VSQGRWVRELLQDVKLGWQRIVRAPGLATVAVLSLAIPIGSNAALLGLLDGFTLRTPPYEEPDELVDIRISRSGQDFSAFSHVAFRELEDAAKEAFAGITGAMTNRVHASDGSGWNDSPNHELVAGPFFQVVGIDAQIGRVFHPGEGVDEGAEGDDFGVDELVAVDPLEGHDEGVVDAVGDLEVVCGDVVTLAVDLAGDAEGAVVGAALGIETCGELGAAAADPGHGGVGRRLVPGDTVGTIVGPPAPGADVAEEADALAHAGAVEVRGRGGDDVEVQDQVLGREGVEVELPDGLAAEGNGGLEDGAGGDDGGDHDEGFAELPGGDLADIEGVAAADGEDDFGVRQTLDQVLQVVLAHAALVLEGARRMGQVWPRDGPGAGRGDGDVVGVLGRVGRQDSAAVSGVPGAAVEVHGEDSGGGVGNDTWAVVSSSPTRPLMASQILTQNPVRITTQLDE